MDKSNNKIRIKPVDSSKLASIYADISGFTAGVSISSGETPDDTPILEMDNPDCTMKNMQLLEDITTAIEQNINNNINGIFDKEIIPEKIVRNPDIEELREKSPSWGITPELETAYNLMTNIFIKFIRENSSDDIISLYKCFHYMSVHTPIRYALAFALYYLINSTINITTDILPDAKVIEIFGKIIPQTEDISENKSEDISENKSEDIPVNNSEETPADKSEETSAKEPEISPIIENTADNTTDENKIFISNLEKSMFYIENKFMAYDDAGPIMQYMKKYCIKIDNQNKLTNIENTINTENTANTINTINTANTANTNTTDITKDNADINKNIEKIKKIISNSELKLNMISEFTVIFIMHEITFI
jgi:hypothetical protein